MQIIPVIDLMGGQVVHARGGHRSQYRPISSELTRSVEPFQVINDLRNFYPFEQFYLADIDSITGRRFNLDFYSQLSQEFEEVEFWLDSGIETSAQLLERAQALSLRHVVGSETLQDLSLLELSEFGQYGILSLDFKAGHFLGQPDLLVNTGLWPKSVIVMTLDMVGSSQGPDMQLLRQIKKNAPECSLFAAGGVRDEPDLALLEQDQIAGALVATSLHNGRLSREQIDKYRKHEHRLS